MIYTNKEQKYIRKLVKSIDPRLQVNFKDNRWYRKNQIISVGTKYEPAFQKWFKQEFPQCQDIHWWLIQLLHEIGHFKTTTKEMQERALIEYSLLHAEMAKTPNPTKEQDWKWDVRYFTMKHEYMATKWAVDFYLDRKDECDLIGGNLPF